MKKTKPQPAIPSPEVSVIPPIAGVEPIQRCLSAGDFLFHKGDRSIGIYFVASGSLRMQRITPDGSTVTLHTARGGEFFAEASLFSERYQCDVVAECASDVWLYSKEELTARLRNDPATLWEFSAGLARGLHALRLRYELKQVRSAPERAMQLLRLRCDDAGNFQTSGTLKDLAAELGLTHEALYRALATSEKQGRIRRHGQTIQICSLKT